MIVPDLNLLLYAINEEAPAHEAARSWWEACLSGHERVGLPWTVVLGFLRLTTSHHVFPSPLSPAGSWSFVDEWLDQPVTSLIHPTHYHVQILKTFTIEHGTGGNLITDAHLAALCVEHDATLYSADNDFASSVPAPPGPPAARRNHHAIREPMPRAAAGRPLTQRIVLPPVVSRPHWSSSLASEVYTATPESDRLSRAVAARLGYTPLKLGVRVSLPLPGRSSTTFLPRRNVALRDRLFRARRRNELDAYISVGDFAD